jgi:hypothetical protein
MIKKAAGNAKPITLLGIPYPSLTAARNAIADIIKDQRLTRKNPQDQVKTISERLIEGWTPEQAFGFESPPPWAVKGYAHPILCAGTHYGSERALARAHNIPVKILHQRLHRDKMTPEAAVGLEPPSKNLETLETLFGCIYMLRHRGSGKCYVGLTIDHPRRASRHFSVLGLALTKPGTIQHAISMYGKAAFGMTVLEDNIPGPQLAARERHWIKQVGSLMPNGYNQNAGGVTGGFGSPVYIDGVRYLGYPRVAEAFGITVSCLMGRLRCGSSLEEAVSPDYKAKTRTIVPFDLGHETIYFPTVAEARRGLGLHKGALHRRRYKLKMSWPDAIRATLADKIRAQDAEEGIICIQGGKRRQRGTPNIAVGPANPDQPIGEAA